MPADELAQPKSPQLGTTNTATVEPEIIPHDVSNAEELAEQLGPERKLSGAKLAPNGLGTGGITDVKMVGRAVRERWPIPLEVRQNVAVWMADVAKNANDRRARVNAVKVLAELDKLNMAQEQADAGGSQVRIDVTSGGKPIGTDLSALTTEEIQRRLEAAGG